MIALRKISRKTSSLLASYQCLRRVSGVPATLSCPVVRSTIRATSQSGVVGQLAARDSAVVA